MDKASLHTQEEAVMRRIEYLYNTSKMTDAECRELYTISKKQCLQNLINRISEEISKL